MSYDPAARRKTPLALKLAAEIAGKGPLPVDRYMARCLWDSDHGYYATREPLGRAGDFITAPEISQTFGELIGLWSAVVWRDAMRAPAALTLSELGPGRGTLMRDCLRATGKVPGFHRAATGHLVELSPPLIEQQKQTLADADVPLHWSADASTIGRPAIVIANEFFDALPVEQWTQTKAGWVRRCVGIDGGGELCFVSSATTDPAAPTLPDAPPGTIAERRRPAQLLRQLTAAGAEAPMALLIIDYGHEKPALGDTLQAVRNHAHEHPLTSPGEADLSAQVDFADIAAAATDAGLAVDGPIGQGEFLGRLGIVERARALMAANPNQAAAIEFGVARLIAPDGMGSRFKVLAARSPQLPPLPGFAPTARNAGR